MRYRTRNYTKKFLNTLEEVNAILKEVKDYCTDIYYEKKPDDQAFGWKAWIWVDKTSLNIAYKRFKPITYIFRLDGEENLHTITGGDAFRGLNISHKVQRVEKLTNLKIKRDCQSSTGLLYKNKKFSNKRVKAYSYDINSAWAYQMMQPIPDITTMRRNSKIKKGEIGFYIGINYYNPHTQQKFSSTLDPYYQISFEEGRECDFVFKLMESPWKSWVMNIYNTRLKAKKSGDKLLNQKCKDKLTYAIGSLQNYNPFVRACIIGRGNLFISKFIDDNTIYCNTDSIFSTVPRPDIEAICGNELGQFKKEHNGDYVAFNKEMIYQWENELPTARGISQGWFKKWEELNGRPFDLLLDKTPFKLNYYRFNPKTFKVEVMEYEEA